MLTALLSLSLTLAKAHARELQLKEKLEGAYQQTVQNGGAWSGPEIG